eukprot:m.257412 g.257412  ORF g.257412 m.257412 type:complete len:402 (-) comp22708_c1_seq1:93-1298(-)
MMNPPDRETSRDSRASAASPLSPASNGPLARMSSVGAPSPSPVPMRPAAAPSPSPGYAPRRQKIKESPFEEMDLGLQPQVPVPAMTEFNDHFDYHGQKISNGPTTLHVQGSSIVVSLDQLQPLRVEGRGVHGTVTKMEHKTTHMVMAIKEIELVRITDEICQRIVRELDILREGSECPFIVDYYGAFYHQSNILICMEYMDVGAFDKLLENPKVVRLPEHIVGKVAVSSVEGLHYLRNKLNIIHRDVKPSNILLNAKGEIKVCDFSVSGELEQSYANTYVGTIHYMAPERIDSGQLGKEYNVLADVWSLGVTLVELATGVYPYPKEKNVYAMLQHIVQGPTPLDKPPFRKEDFSPEFNEFLSLCLQKKAKNRAKYEVLLAHPFAKKDRPQSEILQWIETFR